MQYTAHCTVLYPHYCQRLCLILHLGRCGMPLHSHYPSVRFFASRITPPLLCAVPSLSVRGHSRHQPCVFTCCHEAVQALHFTAQGKLRNWQNGHSPPKKVQASQASHRLISAVPSLGIRGRNFGHARHNPFAPPSPGALAALLSSSASPTASAPAAQASWAAPSEAAASEGCPWNSLSKADDGTAALPEVRGGPSLQGRWDALGGPGRSSSPKLMMVQRHCQRSLRAPLRAALREGRQRGAESSLQGRWDALGGPGRSSLSRRSFKSSSIGLHQRAPITP